jgi:L-threonylcarbamoyladenylate synthase
VTVLLSNPAQRFAPACRKDPGTLGLRVPRLPEHLAALSAITRPVMQSSANMSGEPDAKSLEEVPAGIREGADLVLDGGELPGTPSTVVDLRDFDSERRWHILREGAIERGAVQGVLERLR